jgi:hypothetical protein
LVKASFPIKPDFFAFRSEFLLEEDPTQNVAYSSFLHNLKKLKLKWPQARNVTGDEISNLVLKGWTLIEMAEELGVGQRVLSTRIKVLGLKVRALEDIHKDHVRKAHLERIVNFGELRPEIKLIVQQKYKLFLDE